jgi:thiamine-phosphate diphosphorylase
MRHKSSEKIIGFPRSKVSGTRPEHETPKLHHCITRHLKINSDSALRFGKNVGMTSEARKMNVRKKGLVKDGCDVYCFADSLPLCRKLLEGGARIIQLRAKRLEDNAFFALASDMLALVKSYANALLIINDRVEIALRLRADGIHVGREDKDYREVIDGFPADTIVGVSVDTAEEAIAAEKAGASYVGAGSVFPTSTKPDAVVIGLPELERIVRSV